MAGDQRVIEFAAANLRRARSSFRGMIVDAWSESADTPVGYPMASPRDIESGKVRAARDLFGAG